MERSDYIKKYSDIYSKVSENNVKKRDAIIEILADNLIQADECKIHLEVEGCVSEMSQGKYSIMRVNPWSQAYDAKVKTIQSLIDKLDKLMPDSKTESVTKAGENLAKLVAGGKPVELR